MFGTLRPGRTESGRMGCQRGFQEQMCSLCVTLHSSYGLGARCLTNYDAVFLGLLGHGCREPQPRDLLTQLARPWRCVRRMPNRGDRRARLVAAFSVLTGAISLRDMIADRQLALPRRTTMAGVDRLYSRALQDLSDVGVDTRLVEDALRRHHVAEEGRVHAKFSSLSQPTADAYASIFGCLAETEEARGRYARVGALHGRTTLLADALLDYEDDRRSSSYNVIDHALDFHDGIVSARHRARTALGQLLNGLLAGSKSISAEAYAFVEGAARNLERRLDRRDAPTRQWTLNSVLPLPVLASLFEPSLYERDCGGDCHLTGLGVVAILVVCIGCGCACSKS